MDLMHIKAEFEAGRLSEAVTEPSEQGEGWRLLFHTISGETLMLTDHAGRERVYHSLDHTTEVGRDIGAACYRSAKKCRDPCFIIYTYDNIHYQK